MATQRVKLKRSAQSGKVPLVTDLELGEIAINTFDGKAYFKKDNGTQSIVEIGTGTGGGGGSYTSAETIALYNKNNNGSLKSFDGTETRFQIRNTAGAILDAPSALNLTISLNGVIQEPNSGTPATFNGFYVVSNATTGYDIVFSTAPVSTDEFFGILGGTYSNTSGTSAITYLDDISGAFNGTTTAFTLTKNGSNYSPEFPVAVLVIVGGVVQNPNDAYSITGSTITFTSAPPTGVNFHAIDFKIGPTAEQDFGFTSLVSISTAPPSSPFYGQLWFDEAGGRIYIYYNSGTGGQWIDASPSNIGGVLTLDGGTGAAPSLTFAGDTDTGVYSSGVNNLAFATAGSGRVFIDSTGRVGINSSSPASRLHVEGEIRSHSGAAYTALVHDGTNGSIATNASNLLLYAGGNNNLILHTNGTNRLTVTGTGNIGIGTAAPAAQLHIVNGGGNSESILGQYGTGTQLKVGAYASEAIIYAANNASAALTFYTNSTEKLRITPAGNVGINESNPTSKLQVNGYTKIGNYGGTFQGLSLVNNADATVTRVSFLDSINNLGTIDAHIFFDHYTTGSTAIQFATTPAGDRSTDRRRTVLRITENRDLEIYQDAGRYSIDTAVSAVSLAANATVDFANASGMLVVNNHTNGGVTVYTCGAGAVAAFGNTGLQVGTLTYQVSVNGYRFTNNTGGTATFGFFFVRTRGNA